MANAAGAINLGAGESPPDEELTAYKARTAFLVILGLDGTYQYHPDINVPLIIERPAHPEEVLAGARVIADKQCVQMTVGTTLHEMGEAARQAAQQKEAAAVVALLQNQQGIRR